MSIYRREDLTRSGSAKFRDVESRQIGFLTIEALFSAKGINAPMQVLAYQAQDPQGTTPGRFSFKDALERRERSSEEDLSGTPYFGVEWEQAILLVSKHVFDAINS